MLVARNAGLWPGREEEPPWIIEAVTERFWAGNCDCGGGDEEGVDDEISWLLLLLELLLCWLRTLVLLLFTELAL